MSVIKLVASIDDIEYFDNEKMCLLDKCSLEDYDFSMYKTCIDIKKLADKDVYTYAPFELCNMVIRFELIELITNRELNYELYLKIRNKNNDLVYTCLLDSFDEDALCVDNFHEDYIDANWHIRYINSPLTIKSSHKFFVISSDSVTRELNWFFVLVVDKLGNFVALYEICDAEVTCIQCNSPRFSTLAVFKDDILTECELTDFLETWCNS